MRWYFFFHLCFPTSSPLSFFFHSIFLFVFISIAVAVAGLFCCCYRNGCCCVCCSSSCAAPLSLPPPLTERSTIPACPSLYVLCFSQRQYQRDQFFKLPVCPSFTCFYNRDDTDETNSSNYQRVLALCVCVCV